MHTYLEGEIDELNRQSSDAVGLPAKKSRNSNAWPSIARLLNAPAITAATPIYVAKPAPPVFPQTQTPPIAKPTLPARPAPQRKIANVAPPPVKQTKRLPSALPSKQVIRFDQPEAEEVPLQIPVVASNPGELCPKVDTQVLRQYRDGKSDLSLIAQQLRQINQLIFRSDRSEDDIDRRFAIYNQILPLGFFDGKMAKAGKLSASDQQRWRHLNYLAQVRMIHLYEESIRASAEKIQKIFSGEDFDASWGDRLFSAERSQVSAIAFTGGKNCGGVKSMKQARMGCKLSLEFRFGAPLICRPNNPQLAQSAFKYLFTYHNEAGRWVLEDVIVPLPVRGQGGVTMVGFQAAFSDFEKRALSTKETVSTLESWIQQGLKSSDLLGYDGFLQRQAEQNERSIASKRDTLD